MRRIKLRDRKLPIYTSGEECMNMVTHIVGGGIGLGILIVCLLRASNSVGRWAGGIFGIALISVYTVSSVYHGLRPSTGKKVMQIVDHCMIYFLIAGTYTPILLCRFVPAYPWIGWGLLVWQWGLAALAITLTAIDLRKYRVFSMVCYILMGWGIIFFPRAALSAFGMECCAWLLAGGISYTVGAILYGVGVKVRYMHSVFHIFVVLGSMLQFIAVFSLVA